VDLPLPLLYMVICHHSAIIIGVDVKYRPIIKSIDFHKTSSCLLQVYVHFSVSLRTLRAVYGCLLILSFALYVLFF
jgi:hypothetical protein